MANTNNSHARGYGWHHQKLRRRWASEVAAGHVTCWRCRHPITPGSDWHLGHDDTDRRVYRGPEHAYCNLRAAAEKTNRRDRNTRDW